MKRREKKQVRKLAKLRREKRRKVIISTIVVAILIIVLAAVFLSSKKVVEHPAATVTPKAVFSSKEIKHGDLSKKDIIFTFDGGGGIESGDKILEVLAKHNVKGSFFLTGKMVENYPDFVRKVAATGHEIFNHTYDHTDLTTLTSKGITDELNKMDEVLQKVVGVSTKPYFRAPYGSRDTRVLAVAAADGYESVYWTNDALDWRETSGETAAQVKQNILTSLAPGNIYLMHVGDNITGQILDEIFTIIESKGYKIVSLTQGMLK